MPIQPKAPQQPAPAVHNSTGATVPALELVNVSMTYGPVTALESVSLRVEQDELVTLLGPSGSGKSTLLSLVAGSIHPTSGSIKFNGKDAQDLPMHKRSIGMVFQRYTLFPNRTIFRNVAFPLEVRKVSKSEINRRVSEALRKVGLEGFEDRYPSQISGGQSQRVAVARALVFDPEIMLFDEPLGALDKGLRLELQEEIRAIQRELRVPMLYVTHDQEEAMRLSDRIILMRSGSIQDCDTPRRMYTAPSSVWTAKFLGEANVFKVEELKHQTSPGVYEVELALGTSTNAVKDPNTNVADCSHVLVRPEDCLLEPYSPSNRGIPGSIADVEFLGPIQRVLVKLGDQRVSVICDARDKEWQLNDAVSLNWHAESCRLVPEL